MLEKKERKKKMKMNEYLEFGKLFPLMGVSQLNDVGEMLDSILANEYGNKTCGTIITRRIVDGSVGEVEQEQIAKEIYFMNKHKWDSLLSFADEEVDGYYDKYERVTTEYGKKTVNEKSGTDKIGKTMKIAGFDSVELVDKDSESHETKYGSKTENTNDGTDIKTLESRNVQKETLVAVRMKFWVQYGVVRTLLADVCRTACLPLYDVE